MRWRPFVLSEWADGVVMGIGRDYDVSAHNARVAEWRKEEARRSAEKIKAIGQFGSGVPATSPVNRAVTSEGGKTAAKCREATQPGSGDLGITPDARPMHATWQLGSRPDALPQSHRVSQGTPRKADAAHKADAASTGPIYPLVGLCRAAGLPLPIPEYQFHPVRKWRFDYAFVLRQLAVEIEGGIWTQGRHTRGKGFLADMAKYNAATLLGWRILRYTPDQLGQAIHDLRVMFAESTE